ncbi:MAG: hypothetical protein R2762_15390 [Bryobacteraceae bacterium]
MNRRAADFPLARTVASAAELLTTGGNYLVFDLGIASVVVPFVGGPIVNLVVGIGDLRVEYYDALREGRKVRAEWLVVLHYLAIARAVSIDRILSRIVNSFLGILGPGK